MFGHTSFTINPQNSAASVQKPQKMQSLGSVRRQLPAKPQSVSLAPTFPRQASKQNRDNEVSERFKNHAYNRQPSPVGRFLAAGRSGKDKPYIGTSERYAYSAKERVRASPPKSAAARSSVGASRSDDMRPRMEERNMDQDKRVRPKTTQDKRVKGRPSVSESPSFDNKVLLAVKDVLSRAVIEKGKIDENNINTIIDDLKNRMGPKTPVSNDSDDDTIPLNLNVKRSATMININPDSSPKKDNTFLISKAKPLPGIIRRNIVEPVKKSQKICKTVSNRESSPPVSRKEAAKNINYEVFKNNNYESTVYIDIPDSDYSNFNSLLKKDAEVSRSIEQKKIEDSKNLETLPLKNEQNTEAVENSYSLGDNKALSFTLSDNKVEIDPSYVEGNLGDYDLEACQPHNLWKTFEDIRLQNYIETLIRNMNEQLNGQPSNRVFTNQVETENTVCKSFCVCKVCVSSKASSRNTLTEPPSISSVKEKSQSELKLKNSIANNSIAAANPSKPRQSKVVDKDANKEPHFRILQRNANFEPESKLNLASRYARGPELKHFPSSNVSYSSVAPEETREDLYLQRRVKKTPGKRQMSTRI